MGYIRSGWSWMIACCVTQYQKNILTDEQYEAFLIRDKYSHLAICLRLMEPHSNTKIQKILWRESKIYLTSIGHELNTFRCILPELCFCWHQPRPPGALPATSQSTVLAIRGSYRPQALARQCWEKPTRGIIISVGHSGLGPEPTTRL